AARHRRHKGRGPCRQHQLVVKPFPLLAFNAVAGGVDFRHPCLREQTQIKLFRKLPRRLAGEILSRLAEADHMAEVWFVVFVHAVSGNQRDRNLSVLFADIFYQLSGGEARTNNDDTVIHFASTASTSNTSLPSEHSGHRKLSGTWSHGVPGATSCIGSPVAGS